MSAVRTAIRVLIDYAKLPLRLLRYRPLRGGWIGSYFLRQRRFRLRSVPTDQVVDVIFLLVDHFEPGERKTDEIAAERVEQWCQDHGAIADRHRDSSGRRPQHTWFYRAEYPNPHCARILGDYAYRGYGEVEFHLHHGNDDHESFSAKLKAGLDYFNRHGAMLTAEAEPQRRFAYIAGNWALDNSGGDPAKSGCNTELLALRQMGCYADYTFPAIGNRAQPRIINSIYYATDDEEPKSYDRGEVMRVGGRHTGDLVIFQGPTCIDWRRAAVDDASLEVFTPPSTHRVANWVRSHVHVRGRPEWIFLKIHCHGIQSWDLYKSAELDAMYAGMVAKYTKPPFRLHFVNAREAFNIAKAAEAGRSGDPSQFLDFVVPPPANRKIRCSRPWHLKTYTSARVELDVLEPGHVRIELAEGPVQSVEGPVSSLDVSHREGQVARLAVAGAGVCRVELDGIVLNVEPGVAYDAEGLAALRTKGRS